MAANVGCPSRKRKKDLRQFRDHQGGHSHNRPRGHWLGVWGEVERQGCLHLCFKGQDHCPQKRATKWALPHPESAATGCGPTGNHCALHSLGDELNLPSGPARQSTEPKKLILKPKGLMEFALLDLGLAWDLLPLPFLQFLSCGMRTSILVPPLYFASSYLVWFCRFPSREEFYLRVNVPEIISFISDFQETGL